MHLALCDDHIADISFLSITLTDGTKLRLSLGESGRVKKYLSTYRRRTQDGPSV